MTTTSPYTGTDRYLAYELLHDQEMVVPTKASDIFALGCIGLEVRHVLGKRRLSLIDGNCHPDLLSTTSIWQSET